jgi:hypothetical protein
MPVSRKIAFVCYAIIALVSVVLGLIYLLRGEFMPYHGAALGMDWAAVDSALQTLLLALMDVAGAGWLTLAAALVALLVFVFPHGRLWGRVTLPLLVLIFYGPTLWATLAVTAETPARAPWYGNVMALAAMLVAVVGDAWPALSRNGSGAGARS